MCFKVREFINGLKGFIFNRDGWGLIHLLRGWLMHDLSFLGANYKSEVVAYSRKAANTLLHHGLSGSVKRTVISEQKVTCCSLLDLGLCLKSTQVGEFPISFVPSANNVSIVVVEGIRQHGCENHAEQCGGKDAVLLDTVSDRECVVIVSIV